jgi:glycosyltransferase involved in cell wall biosynthesis
MGSSRIKKLKDIILNFLCNDFYKLSYIVEPNWSIEQDGKYITKNLNKLNLIKSKITTTALGLRNQIIHFGSINTFFTHSNFHRPHKSNKVVVTWFHVVPDDPRIKFIRDAQGYVKLFHTSCNITKNKLIEIGIPREKIAVIPLGVDLNLFKPIPEEEKKQLKKN